MPNTLSRILTVIVALLGTLAAVATILQYLQVAPPPVAPIASPVKVDYFKVTNSAVNLLVNGFLPKDFGAAIGPNTPIVENEVLREARSILERFNTRQIGDMGWSPKSENSTPWMNQDEFEKKLDSNQLQRYRSSQKELYLGDLQFSFAVPDAIAIETFFHSQIMPKDYKYYFIESDDEKFPMQVVLWRYLRPADLENYEQKYAAFNARYVRGDPSKESMLNSAPPIAAKTLSALRWLTTQNFPPDFIFVRGAPGEHYGFTIDAVLPSLTLEVAVVENTSGKRLQIEGVSRKLWNGSGLRSPDATNQQLHSIPATNYALPASTRDIAPGERILIPLRITFGKKDEKAPNGWEGYRSANSLPPYVARAAKEAVVDVPVAKVWEGEIANVVAVPKLLSELLHPTPEPNAAEYDVGPTVWLESIRALGQTWQLRKPDWQNMSLLFGLGKGSCPVVFTRLRGSSEWRSEGVVLAGASNVGLKRTELKVLRNFDGHLRLEEFDPEVSEIESVEVVVRTNEGAEMVLKPKQFGPWPIRLHQGEHATLFFPEFDSAKHVSPQLRIRGFYKAYSQSIVENAYKRTLRKVQ